MHLEERASRNDNTESENFKKIDNCMARTVGVTKATPMVENRDFATWVDIFPRATAQLDSKVFGHIMKS